MHRLKTIWLILLGILLGLLVLLLILGGYFYIKKDAFTNILVKEINKNIEAQVDIGATSFEFWRTFPSFSIRLEKFSIGTDSSFTCGNNEPFFSAGNIYFELGLASVTGKNLNVHRIAIEDASVNICINRQGVANYNNIVSQDDDGGESSTLNVSQLGLSNVIIHYVDEQTREDFTSHIIAANVEEQKFESSSVYDIEFATEQNTFIPYASVLGHTIGFHGKLRTNTSNTLSWDGDIDVGDLQTVTSGTYNQNNGNYESVLEYVSVPISVVQYILEKEHVEDIVINSGIVALRDIMITNFNSRLSIDGQFDTKLKTVLYGQPVEVATFGNASVHGERINIAFKKLDANKKGSVVQFVGSYKYPSNTLKGSSNFTIQMEDWAKEMEGSPIKSAMGKISGTVNLDGSLNSDHDLDKIIRKGTVEFKETGILLTNHLDIENINGEMQLNEGEIFIPGLTLLANKNKLEYEGTVKGLAGFLNKESILELNGITHSHFFDIGQFLNLSSDTTESSGFELDDSIRLNLSFDADEVVQDLFGAEKVRGNLRKYGNRVELQGFSLQTAKGAVQCSGILIQQANKDWFTTLNAELDGVNVNEMFYQFKNFGQDYLVDKNINGSLNSKIDAEFVMTPGFDIRRESIYLSTNVVISNGELIDYELLNELSSFASIEELQHVKFEKLKNNITIQNSMITIPEMEVNSSALNIRFSGNHSFNGDVDYQVAVGLSDVLFSKFRNKHKNKGSRGSDGKMMVYINIKGNTDDYSISFDKFKRNKSEAKTEEKKFEVEFDAD